jgi:hypothetical protein
VKRFFNRGLINQVVENQFDFRGAADFRPQRYLFPGKKVILNKSA